MRFAEDFRSIARNALNGKWKIAVLVGLVATLLGAVEDMGPEVKINIDALYRTLSTFDYFGRNEIINVLNISPAGASKLISKLLEFKVIRPVLGHGKGKYCFNITGVNYE